MHKQPLHHKKIAQNLFLFSIFFILLLATGCNNDNDDKNWEREKIKEPVDHGTLRTDSSTSALTGYAFYTLQLDSQKLVELFGGNDDKKVTKLIFQVIDSNNAGNGLGLIAYGSKNNGEKVTGPIGFTVLSNSPTTITGPVILGDQELTLGEIRKILSLKGKGKLKPELFKTLRFVPLKDGNNHLFYTVIQFGVTSFDGSGVTNPSPPATPCDSNCDYNL